MKDKIPQDVWVAAKVAELCHDIVDTSIRKIIYSMVMSELDRQSKLSVTDLKHNLLIEQTLVSDLEFDAGL